MAPVEIECYISISFGSLVDIALGMIWKKEYIVYKMGDVSHLKLNNIDQLITKQPIPPSPHEDPSLSFTQDTLQLEHENSAIYLHSLNCYLS